MTLPRYRSIWFVAGVQHAAWLQLQFWPAELLYRPYKTHACLQLTCLLSLIHFVGCIIVRISELWTARHTFDILFAGRFCAVIVSTIDWGLMTSKDLFTFGVGLFDTVLDVFATNARVAFSALYACSRLGIFCAGVLGLDMNKYCACWEDVFDPERILQTVVKLIFTTKMVVWKWVFDIARILWKFIRRQPASKTDYDSPETKQILASIKPEMSRSRAKRTAPTTQKPHKSRQQRTNKHKTPNAPLPSQPASG